MRWPRDGAQASMARARKGQVVKLDALGFASGFITRAWLSASLRR
jgi:hypothetical protein